MNSLRTFNLKNDFLFWDLRFSSKRRSQPLKKVSAKRKGELCADEPTPYHFLFKKCKDTFVSINFQRSLTKDLPIFSPLDGCFLAKKVRKNVCFSFRLNLSIKREYDHFCQLIDSGDSNRDISEKLKNYEINSSWSCHRLLSQKGKNVC